MTPGTYNFKPQKRGDTFSGFMFEVTQNSIPVDFTDAVITIQLRVKPGSKVILEWKTSDGSITISGAGNNVINMNVKTGPEMNVAPNTYKYDINVVLASGVTNTYVAGVFPIVDDITR